MLSAVSGHWSRRTRSSSGRSTIYWCSEQKAVRAGEIVKLAASHGFEFSVEDLKEHLSGEGTELSSSDLEAVVGGSKIGILAYKMKFFNFGHKDSHGETRPIDKTGWGIMLF